MENLRFILFMTFCVLIFLIWEAWQEDYGPKPPVPVVTSVDDGSPAVDTPAATANGELPAIGTADPATVTPAQGSADLPATGYQKEPTGERIVVTTDLLRVEIDTLGGDIRILDLITYPVEQGKPNEPFRLLNDEPDELMITQSGLLSAPSMAPNHQTLYQVSSNKFQLQAGQDELRVPLTWRNDQGIEVTKTYIFRRGHFLVELEYKVSNQSGVVWQGRQYEQLKRVDNSEEKSSFFMRTYMGGVIYSEETKYEKVDFEDMSEADLDLDLEGGWDAFIQHYFLAAWIPPQNEKNEYYSRELPHMNYILGTKSELKSVQPGQQATFKAKFFAGPKLQGQMEEAAEGLQLTVDYGVLTFIGKWIFWLLVKIHSIVGNWGWAIVGVTFCVKAIFFKLSEASYRSMAKMRALQPKIKEIRDRYDDDRQKMHQETMQLYKTEKVNPLGGCFPILVQIPVFISLYWVLIESVELRQAPFILWITDLSVRDPYFVLPALMGISMFIQQRLNPTPVDPIQEKVIKLFPIIFGVFFAFFPAGLVLYWVVNNTLSITQQAYITKNIAKQMESKKNKAATS